MLFPIIQASDFLIAVQQIIIILMALSLKVSYNRYFFWKGKYAIHVVLFLFQRWYQNITSYEPRDVMISCLIVDIAGVSIVSVSTSSKDPGGGSLHQHLSISIFFYSLRFQNLYLAS